MALRTVAERDGRLVGRLENRTLWERVHEHLREEILANRLPPGSVLGEVALAESLGVSRGPIREALGRLAAEGLVTVRPRRGAVVSALTAREFLEAYQVREALEALAIGLAVPRLTGEEFGRLQALVDEQARHVERGNVDAFFQANAAFHELIVASSGNETLKEMYRQLVSHMGRYRMRSLALRGSLRRSVSEHRAILRAVKAGDADKAVHLLSEHIRVPRRRLESASEEEVVLTR
jgi:DNA-binding GntR family transcriptional regulator